MPTKYLELDSNYRDRTLYPNPADFTVNISQSGMRNNTNAFDPVTYAYPQIVFSPGDFTGATTSLYIHQLLQTELPRRLL